MEHSFCLLLMITAGIICQVQAQDSSTIRPIRHSLHPGGRQSLDGSLPNGGCTSVNDGGDICNLQDGGTSVLVDNTILPLNGLNGDWARDLYTVERPSGTFISIGFDFGTSVQVERVELVLFNCRQRSIRSSSIQIYTYGVTNLFPQPDPKFVGSLVGERLLGVGVNSCTNLYRVCVTLLGVNNRIYYIVFPRSAASNRVYLAELIFYTDTRTCGNDTLVTEPVTIATTTSEEATEQTVPTITTKQQTEMTQAETTQTIPRTTTIDQQTKTTQFSSRTTTTDIAVDMCTAQALPCVCTNTSIAPLIATAFTATLLATIIIVTLHIPLYVHHRRLLTSTKVSKETAAPADHEEATYEQIDETKHGAFLELRQNEAYGTARVTG